MCESPCKVSILNLSRKACLWCVTRRFGSRNYISHSSQPIERRARRRAVGLADPPALRRWRERDLLARALWNNESDLDANLVDIVARYSVSGQKDARRRRAIGNESKHNYDLDDDDDDDDDNADTKRGKAKAPRVTSRQTLLDYATIVVAQRERLSTRTYAHRNVYFSPPHSWLS